MSLSHVKPHVNVHFSRDVSLNVELMFNPTVERHVNVKTDIKVTLGDVGNLER